MNVPLGPAWVACVLSDEVLIGIPGPAELYPEIFEQRGRSRKFDMMSQWTCPGALMETRGR